MNDNIRIERFSIFSLFIVIFGYVTLKTLDLVSSATSDLIFKTILLTPIFLIFIIVLNHRHYILTQKNIQFTYLLFVILALASNLWTIDFKYTFVKSSNVMLVFIFFLSVNFLINNKYLSVVNAIKVFIFPMTVLFAYGLLSFNPSVRLFLGGSSSLWGLIFSLSCVLSFIQYKHSNKLFFLFLTYSYFLATLLIGSVRGFLALVVFFLIWNKYYKSILLFIIFFTFIGFEYTQDLVDSKYSLIHQIGRNFESTKVFFKGAQDLHVNSSGGLRIALLKNGIEYFMTTPSFFGDGFASSYAIFENMGKRSYSHNGFLETLLGLGVIGLTVFTLFVYLLFKNNKYTVGVYKRVSLSILGFLFIQFFFGKPFESLYLTFLIVIYLNIHKIEFHNEK